MGKLGTPKRPHPHPANIEFLFGMRDCPLKCSETTLSCDPSLGRRMSGTDSNWSKAFLLGSMKGNTMAAKQANYKGFYGGKRQNWFHKNLRSIGFAMVLMGFIFWLDSLLFVDFKPANFHKKSVLEKSMWKDDRGVSEKKESYPSLMYGRLLNLASSSLAEREVWHDPNNTWKEPSSRSSVWKPCADGQNPKVQGSPKKSNGFLLVSANGGLNQQRVAVCNAVAVASLLNATLVVPRFLYSSVWKDPSQFGDIYQEEYFMNRLKDDITITKELPPHLRSIDLEALGSVVTDAQLVKEAKPTDYIKLVLPLLLQNGVVHLLGYGNRLGFDPLPPHLQKLRCKCNFHALKYVPKIQEVGSLLVRRIRHYDSSRNRIDKELLGSFMPSNDAMENVATASKGPSKYLALHLRFEVDMVAYSLCEFGGGENERKELQAYRETHFPLVLQRLAKSKPASPEELRISGRCPLTPEEAGLLLAGHGLERDTYIYLAGSHIYGGKSRMKPFTSLYPNLVTKEDLLTPSELEPFKNFSSQLAALDFIVCATADVFAMTDSGSQLSSLVSGYRTYFGGGHAPTLRPNRKRLAAILSEHETIAWNRFQNRVEKMIEEGQRVHVRRYGQSVYRLPRSPECMCKSH